MVQKENCSLSKGFFFFLTSIGTILNYFTLLIQIRPTRSFDVEFMQFVVKR